MEIPFLVLVVAGIIGAVIGMAAARIRRGREDDASAG